METANRNHANRPTAITLADRNRAAILAKRNNPQPLKTWRELFALAAVLCAMFAPLVAVAH